MQSSVTSGVCINTNSPLSVNVGDLRYAGRGKEGIGWEGKGRDCCYRGTDVKN